MLALAGVLALVLSAGADVPALKVPRPAEPFPLTDVRLLDGPFRDAMLRDQKYLLSLEPDRLLHTFRLNVKLSSSAQPLGGWEDPTCDLRGHSLGHYLSALSLMYASTGDARFKQRVDYIVGALAQCQSNSVSAGFNPGYLSAFPESLIDRVEKSQPVWAPWYTLHKIFAGLRDAHLFCDSAAARDVLVKLADWAGNVTRDMTDEQFEKMLGVEHGGMNEVLADLYADTGDKRWLDLSYRFEHRAFTDPLKPSRSANYFFLWQPHTVEPGAKIGP